MRPLYILAALTLLISCAHEPRIQWDSVDYGIERGADSYREETHK
jgi:hypothetical protein